MIWTAWKEGGAYVTSPLQQRDTTYCVELNERRAFSKDEYMTGRTDAPLADNSSRDTLFP